MHKKIKAGLLGMGMMMAGLLAVVPAHAAQWSIQSVLNGTDGSFGFSGFHDASGSNVMSGTNWGSMSATGSGSFDDVTGAFNGSFSMAGGPGFTLSGILNFGAASNTPLGTLNLTFNSAFHGITATTLGFVAGTVCCGAAGTDAPNSFIASGANRTMTLWGADGFDGIGPNFFEGNHRIGMDLRLTLTPAIPEPEIYAMLGMGLGLLGWAGRRRKQQSAV